MSVSFARMFWTGQKLKRNCGFYPNELHEDMTNLLRTDWFCRNGRNPLGLQLKPSTLTQDYCPRDILSVWGCHAEVTYGELIRHSIRKRGFRAQKQNPTFINSNDHNTILMCITSTCQIAKCYSSATSKPRGRHSCLFFLSPGPMCTMSSPAMAQHTLQVLFHHLPTP